MLPDSATLTTEFRPDLLNGVQVIKGSAFGLSRDAQGDGAVKAEQPFMAIPYATWANRGRGQMAVWLARTDARRAADAVPDRRVDEQRSPTSRSSKNPRNINDGEEPRALERLDVRTSTGGRATAAPPTLRTAARSGGRQPARNQCSQGEWVEMTFAEAGDGVGGRRSTGSTTPAAAASACRHRGDCSTRMATTWKPVAGGRRPFGVAKDAWNTVAFTPVKTTALRIELKMQPGVSAGVQEWKVK